MNIFREYRCDFGHQWMRFSDENADSGESALCPFGHPAITEKKCPPIDSAAVGIMPAGRITDLVKNTVSAQARYFLTIKNWRTGQERIIWKAMEWTEAISQVEKFRDSPWSKANEIADRLEQA